MTNPIATGPQQQINASSGISRALGRFSVPIAPAQVAAFSDGRVVAVYECLPPEYAVSARIVSPDGSLSQEINVSEGVSAASVAVLPNDDFVVAFYYRSEYGQIFTHLYSSDGSSKVGPHILIAQGLRAFLSRFYVSAPSVAGAWLGQFVVIFNKGSWKPLFTPPFLRRNSIAAYSVYDPNKFSQSATISIGPTAPLMEDWRYNACPQIVQMGNSGRFGSVFQTKDGRISTTTCLTDGSQMVGDFPVGSGDYPTIAWLEIIPGQDRYVIAWHRDGNVYFRLFDPTRAAVTVPQHIPAGPEIQANQYGPGKRPALATLTSRRILVAWETPGFAGIRARVFHPSGSPETNEFSVTPGGESGAAPSIVGTPNDGFYALWMSYPGSIPPPAVNWVIKGQFFGFV